MRHYTATVALTVFLAVMVAAYVMAGGLIITNLLRRADSPAP